jgi:hypothetical protein
MRATAAGSSEISPLTPVVCLAPMRYWLFHLIFHARSAPKNSPVGGSALSRGLVEIVFFENNYET